jgi:hypothetical protein
LVLALMLPALPAGAADLAASPDVGVSLSGTPVRDREAAIDDLLGGILIEDFGGLPDGVDVDALHQDMGATLFSTDTTVSLPGLLVATPDDVVKFDGFDYTLEFDGGAHGVPAGTDLDAVARLPSGELLVSFDVAVELGGVRADDEDLLHFDGSAFTLFFDASAAHAGWADADLDAVALPEPRVCAGLAAGAALLAGLARGRRRNWMHRR